MSKGIVLFKWDAIVVSITSIIYGFQLILSPQLLNAYRAYEVISYLLDSRTFGVIFISLGVLKIVAIFKNSIRIKSTSISLLGALWAFFFTGFVLSPVANSLWALPLAMFLLCFGIALKEWTH